MIVTEYRRHRPGIENLDREFSLQEAMAPMMATFSSHRVRSCLLDRDRDVLDGYVRFPFNVKVHCQRIVRRRVNVLPKLRTADLVRLLGQQEQPNHVVRSDSFVNGHGQAGSRRKTCHLIVRYTQNTVVQCPFHVISVSCIGIQLDHAMAPPTLRSPRTSRHTHHSAARRLRRKSSRPARAPMPQVMSDLFRVAFFQRIWHTQTSHVPRYHGRCSGHGHQVCLCPDRVANDFLHLANRLVRLALLPSHQNNIHWFW